MKSAVKTSDCSVQLLRCCFRVSRHFFPCQVGNNNGTFSLHIRTDLQGMCTNEMVDRVECLYCLSLNAGGISVSVRSCRAQQMLFVVPQSIVVES